jgi:hypothetical protein
MDQLLFLKNKAGRWSSNTVGVMPYFWTPFVRGDVMLDHGDHSLT